MQPQQKQRPSDSIAEVRQNVNNGATPKEARATLKQLKTGVQPTVSADSLMNAPKQVTVPQPVLPSIPSSTLNIAKNVARDTDGFISAQTEEAKQLKEMQATYGALNSEGSLSDVFKNTQEQYGVTPESFRELKDLQLQLNDLDTGSGVTQTRIEGAAGQTLATAQREVTQEQKENAVRSAGLASRAAVLQGNIQTATQLAKDAVNIAYQDRTLKATNLLNQIEMLQGQVDKQDAQLLEEEKRGYEAELAAIKEVKDATANAMVNGATQAEISQLTDPTIDDATKLALAQSITARGNNEMRGLDMEAKRSSLLTDQAQRANIYSQIEDRETRLTLAQEAATLDDAKALAAGLTEKEAASEKALGMFSMLNELSTHPGFGAAVGPNAFARGLSPTGAVAAFVTGDRSDFISLADQVANTLTLENMDKLKGPATDKDVELVAASVSKLKNRDMSQSDYGREITKIATAMKRIAINNGATAEQLEFYGLADGETISEFDAAWGVGGETTSSVIVNTNF